MKWLHDENGNKCSVEYFGNEEAAQKALDSLHNPDERTERSLPTYDTEKFFNWEWPFEEGSLEVQRVTKKHLPFFLDFEVTSEVVSVKMVPKAGMQ